MKNMTIMQALFMIIVSVILTGVIVTAITQTPPHPQTPVQVCQGVHIDGLNYYSSASCFTSR